MCKNRNALDCVVLFSEVYLRSTHHFYIQSISISTYSVSYNIPILFNKRRLEKLDMFSVFRGIAEH